MHSQIDQALDAETPLEREPSSYRFIDKFAIGLAILSFVCGTAVFVYYVLTKDQEVAFFGLGYVLIAGAINLLMLAALLISFFFLEGSRRSRLNAIGILLLNIPIAAVYYGLFIHFYISPSGF